MGFSIRKRTKGKGTHTNFSLSSKGAHVSQSFKIGGFAINLSPDRKTMASYNFGNGIRYHFKSDSVAKTPKVKKTKESISIPNYVSTDDKRKTVVLLDKYFDCVDLAYNAGHKLTDDELIIFKENITIHAELTEFIRKVEERPKYKPTFIKRIFGYGFISDVVSLLWLGFKIVFFIALGIITILGLVVLIWY
jgi:hypothetical protein